MNRNQLMLIHLLQDTGGADLIEYSLIGVALLLALAATASSTAARLVTSINFIGVLSATCMVTAVVGFVLPLTAAIKGD